MASSVAAPMRRWWCDANDTTFASSLSDLAGATLAFFFYVPVD
jgi:hypothetical protein